jgi:hypothetical protein
LLALSNGAAHPKAEASSAHSKHFAQLGGGFAALGACALLRETRVA